MKINQTKHAMPQTSQNFNKVKKKIQFQFKNVGWPEIVW